MMGRGGAKPKAGEAGEGLEARKKALEKELHDVEEKLAAQQLARERAGDEPGAKKGKKDKPAKEKKVKKTKAPKAHPSSKAGPGFSVALEGDSIVVANINKKAHAYRCVQRCLVCARVHLTPKNTRLTTRLPRDQIVRAAGGRCDLAHRRTGGQRLEAERCKGKACCQVRHSLAH